MATPFRVRTVDLGLPEDARAGYGTKLVGTRARRTFFFTYTRPPATNRLVAFDLDARAGVELSGMTGELRAGVVDESRGVVHTLTSHGLFEIGLSPLRVLRKVKAGIPTHASGLSASAALDRLMVWRKGPDPTPIVSVRRYAVESTSRIGAVQVVMDVRGKPTAMSFFTGKARALDGAGATTRIPTLGAPLPAGDAIFGISEAPSPGPAEDESEIGPGQGFVVKVDARTLATEGSCEAPDVEDLLGFDAAGRLVAVTETAVVLIDPKTMRIAARKETGGTLWAPLFSCDLVGPSTIVALLAPRFSRAVRVVEWDADATRPVVATAPPASKPAGKTEVIAGRTTHAKKTFDHVTLTHDRSPYGGAVLERCVLDGGSLDGRGGRLIVRDVTLERCVLRACGARNVVFEDCVLSHPKTSGRQTFVGCAFRHVTLRGPTGWLHIEPWDEASFLDVPRSFLRQVADANAAFYRDVDWALDVRAAVPDALRIRGIPLDLVRRDPGTLPLVRREHALHAVWRSDEVQATTWLRDIESLAAGDEPGAFLHMPDATNKRRSSYERALRALGAAGVLDERTGVG